MSIIVVGLNYRNTPIEIREKLYFSEKNLSEPLDALGNVYGIKERVILSTCNRVEIYAKGGDISQSFEKIKKFLSDHHKFPLKDLEKHLYCYFDKEAICHLFRVASGLDAMVVGEPQVLGQVKSAYAIAKGCNACGFVLGNFFEKAFSVAKKIRSNTGIGSSAVCVSYAAVELAKKIFEDLNDKSVMLIGAGEMSEQAARYLVSSGTKLVFVTNRTFSRAKRLAEELNGEAVHFEFFPKHLILSDIIICSTGAPHYIIKKEQVQDVLNQRRNKPMFFIDISVPRNIDPEVNKLSNVYLYDIDDLKNVVEANIREREKEAEKAEEMIVKEIKSFLGWLESLESKPTILTLKQKAEEIRQQELKEAYSKLGKISEKEKKILDSLTQALVNKMLHNPIVSLKKRGVSDNGEEYIKVTRKLFKLDDE
ncbi:MAG TPA: glutamyl-tRNA reductase [Nitrospinota bacterium]|nr:glutamyl-tRNA reductase [Nitrospinota bacterium]